MRLWLAPWIVIAIVLAGAGHAQVPINDRARELFRTGVTLLEDPAGPRYEEAYRAFRAAHRESPSPKILGNLGLCAMMLERDGEAIEAYQRYLREVGDIGADEREHIERELSVLAASAVPLRLTVSPGDATIIDERRPIRGETVTNRYEAKDGVLSTRIRAGQHRLVVRRDGHRDEVWNVEASPGSPLEREIRLSPTAAPEPPVVVPGDTEPPQGSVWSEPLVITGLTVSAAATAATAVTMGLALANHADYEDARSQNDVARGSELRDRGETLNLVADVLLVGAIVSTLATATMILAWPSDDTTVDVSLGPASLALGVTW